MSCESYGCLDGCLFRYRAEHRASVLCYSSGDMSDPEDIHPCQRIEAMIRSKYNQELMMLAEQREKPADEMVEYLVDRMIEALEDELLSANQERHPDLLRGPLLPASC